MAPSSEDFTLCHSGQEPGESPNSDFLFANTCCSPAVAVRPSPAFLLLIQNAFLLITIILKVLKRINRWLSCASKGASRLAFMALSNSS